MKRSPTLLAALAATSALSAPAAATPTLGPVVPVDMPITTPKRDGEKFPTVASSGSNYLVVWVDGRDGSPWANVVDKTGKPQYPGGFRAAAAPDQPPPGIIVTPPTVAFGGGNPGQALAKSELDPA
jgi:hypothetical protein